MQLERKPTTTFELELLIFLTFIQLTMVILIENSKGLLANYNDHDSDALF